VGEAPDLSTPTPSTPEEHNRINTYFVCLDKVVTEMRSRFTGNDQNVLCALGSIIADSKPSDETIQTVTNFYNIDEDLLKSEKDIFTNFSTESEIEFSNAVSVVEYMHRNKLDVMLPTYSRVAKTLATIPATSCTSERSFSALRRMKTYIRNTMGQSRLHWLAIMNIERGYTNSVMLDIDRIIDIFARKSNRDAYFF
jgi:hypothetical protein